MEVKSWQEHEEKEKICNGYRCYLPMLRKAMDTLHATAVLLDGMKDDSTFTEKKRDLDDMRYEINKIERRLRRFNRDWVANMSEIEDALIEFERMEEVRESQRKERRKEQSA